MNQKLSVGEQYAGTATARKLKTEDRAASRRVWFGFYMISHAEHFTCEM